MSIVSRVRFGRDVEGRPKTQEEFPQCRQNLHLHGEHDDFTQLGEIGRSVDSELKERGMHSMKHHIKGNISSEYKKKKGLSINT